MKRSSWVGLVSFGLLTMWSIAQLHIMPVVAEPEPVAAPVVLIDVHAEVHADGAGQARAMAMAVDGQARADIESQGRAQGQAYANAPVAAAVLPVTVVPAVTPASSPATIAAVPPGLYVIVATDLANLRSAPDLLAPIIGVAPQGARFAVQGQDAQPVAWWEICCTNGRRAWVFADLVVTEGQVGNSLLAMATPTISTATIPTLAAPTVLPTALPTPTPDYPFAVELVEQHREANTATLYAFVHAQGNALDGYYLNVTRNGQAVPGELVRSAAVPLGTTASGSPGSVDDRIYNLKMAWETRQMFPGFVPYGAWRVQLIDGAGQPVGPAVLFELVPDAAQLEMYVRYEKRE